jgi:hypothetical protein
MRHWLAGVLVLLMLPFGSTRWSSGTMGASVHPHLGDSLAVWERVYGRHLPSDDQIYYYLSPCPHAAQHRYWITIELGVSDTVTRTLCPGDARPSDAVLMAQATAFFPPDYQSKGTIMTEYGKTPLYFSAHLAAMPNVPMLSQNCTSTKHVKPGIFSLTLRPRVAKSMWQIGLGECP